MISAAFGLGLFAKRLGLPPLVGFLVAGFLLHSCGIESNEALDKIADLGVTLLLFSIGLKLRIQNLLRSEIWAGSTLHMLASVVLLGLFFCGLSASGILAFSELSPVQIVLLSFALSFSSTVFAVKVLEEKGEMESLHGRIAIGILIMQDLFAVVFLTASTGKIPSLWALLVLPLIVLLRPAWNKLLGFCGHGEMLVLFGLFLALGIGAGGFELVGLKADLGSLLVGILLGGHPKTSELAKSLLGLKDVFLVGFFLSIGLSGTPTLSALLMALILVFFVSVKVLLYFVFLCRFNLRARTSLLSSLSLANYSEFGLLVTSIAAKNEWIPQEWLYVLAIAVSLSFVLASPLNVSALAIYARTSHLLKRYETSKHHPEEEPISTQSAQIAVIGMGRLGTSTYDMLTKHREETIVGIDYDKQCVEEHNAAGRNVIHGDLTDLDFWERLKQSRGSAPQLVVLCMPQHEANLRAVSEILEHGFKGSIAATAQYDDQVEELQQAGVHSALNIYTEAGLGLADVVEELYASSNANKPLE